jgi:hypothetical protein
MNTENTFGNTTAEADFIISSPGFVVTFKGMLIDSTDPISEDTQTGPYETMPLTFDYENKKVTFQASDKDTDTPELSMAINGSGSNPDYMFELSGLELSQGKEVEMSFDVISQTLTFKDNDADQNQTYNLEVTQILADGTKNVYQKNDITGGSGIGAEIDFSGWDGVSDPPIKMLAADNNNNYLPIIVNDN